MRDLHSAESRDSLTVGAEGRYHIGMPLQFARSSTSQHGSASHAEGAADVIALALRIGPFTHHTRSGKVTLPPSGERSNVAQTTTIEWTETTWNPVVGCTKVSAGCANCYAERMANRLVAIRLLPPPVSVTVTVAGMVSVKLAPHPVPRGESCQHGQQSEPASKKPCQSPEP